MMRLAAACLLLTLAGCRVDGGGSDVPPVPTPPPTAATDLPAPEPPRGCVLVAQDSVALYARPSVQSPRFGMLMPGDSVRVGGQATGFVGVEPETAQSPDLTGPFRLRYASSEAPFSLRGDCAALASLPRLDPTACYQMARRAVAMHVRPDTASAVVATIPEQGFATVLRRAATGWVSARLGDDKGPPGWIAPADANLGGIDCAAL